MRKSNKILACIIFLVFYSVLVVTNVSGNSHQNILLTTVKLCGSNAINVNWTKIPGAKSYQVKSGKKVIKRIRGTSFKVKKIGKKKIVKGRKYRFKVVACRDLKGKKPIKGILTNTATINVGKKPKKITCMPSFTVNIGESVSMHAKNVVKYISDNMAVAIVQNGYIKGMHEGKAYIYVISSQGLYIKCSVNVKALQYTVKFDMNGVLKDAPKAQIVKKNGKIKEPPQIEYKEGDEKIFVGWSRGPAINDFFDFEKTPITSDLTLYAVWKVPRCIDFYDGTQKLKTEYVGDGMSYSGLLYELPDDSNIQKHVGWGTKLADRDSQVKSNDVVTKDTILYALYKPKYKVKFMKEDEQYGDPQYVVEGETYKLPDLPENDGTHVYNAWGIKRGDKSLEIDEPKPITENTTFYALYDDILTDSNTKEVYEPLEYIEMEAGSNVPLNTGIVLGEDLKILSKFECLNQNENSSICFVSDCQGGNYESEKSKFSFYYECSSGTNRATYKLKIDNIFSETSAIKNDDDGKQPMVVRVDSSKSTSTIDVNGMAQTLSKSFTIPTEKRNLYILPKQSECDMRLYYLNVESNGKKACYVPVMQAYGNKIGLYDTVSETYKFDICHSGIGTLRDENNVRTFAVMGDSISTFKGYVADGCAYYFPAPKDNFASDVDSVEKIWWYQMMNSYNSHNLFKGTIQAWSGSSIVSVIGHDTHPSICMAGMERINALDDDGDPDLIIVYGGTNDCQHMVNEGYGGGSFEYTETLDFSKNRWETFANGLRDMVLRMKYTYPKSKILVCLLPYINNNQDVGTNSNSLLNAKRKEINELINICSEKYEIDTFNMRGVNFKHASGIGVEAGTHFNAESHKIFGQAIGDYISAKYGW